MPICGCGRHAPLLARGRIGRARAWPGARSAPATGRDRAETSRWRAYDRSNRAGDRLRVSGPAIPVLEPDCAARNGDTLERISVLRPSEGTRPISRLFVRLQKANATLVVEFGPEFRRMPTRHSSGRAQTLGVLPSNSRSKLLGKSLPRKAWRVSGSDPPTTLALRSSNAQVRGSGGSPAG